MGTMVVAFCVGQRRTWSDFHDGLHAMFRRFREGKETVGQHLRLCPFAYLHIDLDLLHSGGVGQAETHVDRLSDLCARFNNQFSNDGVRSFLHVDAEAGNGSMTEDAMPVRDDMRDARIVEDRWLSSDHREGASQLVKLGHSCTLLRRNERRSVRGNDRRFRVDCRRK